MQKITLALPEFAAVVCIGLMLLLIAARLEEMVAIMEKQPAAAAENAALQHENALLVDQLRACGCGES